MPENKEVLDRILDIADKVSVCVENDEVEKYLMMLDNDIVGLDTETSGLDPYGNYELEQGKWISKAFIRLITLEANDTCVIFDLRWLNAQSINLIREYLTDPKRILVIQNAKFDLKWMLTYLQIEKFNRVYCTMLASQVLSCGKVSYGHNLKSIVGYYFDYVLEKELGASDWSKDDLDDEQIVYAARDACFLRPIRELQIERLKQLDLVEAARIEFQCAEPVAYMELCGLRLNTERWKRNAERNKIRAIRMYPKISKALEGDNSQQVLFDGATGFKVSSPKQITEAMRNLGIELPVMSKKGVDKETIQIEYLEKIKDRHPSIPLIIKHATLKKGYSSYGETWLEKVHPVTSRLHPDIFQIGTETYRFSIKNPNLQQIPIENIYRNCFIPDSGNSLIGADYSQVELRLLAEASQDSAMIKAFNENLDFHVYTAAVVFNTPYEELLKNMKINAQYKIYRARAKNLNFGIVYGIGAKRFAANADISIEEAYQIINNYFELYSGLKQWLDWAKKEARWKWKSRTLSGRMFRHTHSKDDDWPKIGASERMGCSFPIQGSSADITKVALRNIYDEFGKKVKIVNCIHDEIVIECETKKAKKYKPMFERCMVAAGEEYIKSVPVLVESEIMDKWSK